MRAAAARSIALLLLVPLLLPSAWSEEPPTDAPSGEGSREAPSPTLTPFGDLVELGAALQISPEDGQPLVLEKQPLVAWSNPTRQSQQHGCIFVWNQNGRPQVIGSLFTFQVRSELRLKHQLHSLSQSPLTGAIGDRVIWNPTEPGIQWKSLAEATPPHTSERLRLTQMRGIARRYEATLERSGGARTPLELKPTPIYRYTSKQENVVDGAIFSFANGTDPDVLLLIEAFQNENSDVQWRIAFARFHFWKVFVKNTDGEIVWQADDNFALATMTMGEPGLMGLPYVSYEAQRMPAEE